jgi:transcription initiation factor IIF auxiliary subunit
MVSCTGEKIMAKVQHRKAAKDYPDNNIKKGEMYYYTKIKTGPYSSREMRQKEPFKPSQLTSSEYLSSLYSWDESLAALTSMDDAQGLVDEIRELGEAQQEKLDNMPEGLQQGDTGQMIQERIDACETAASEIEEIISDYESEKDDHECKRADYYAAEAAVEEATEPAELEDAQIELSMLDDPGDFDESEFLDRVKEVSVG